MNYFVVAIDGQKFGPADIATLNLWIQEGRILQSTQLENAATGERVTAGHLPGLSFSGPTNPYSAPASYQQYPRAGFGGMDDGSGDIRNAWYCIIAGFLCCPIAAAGGIYYASLAQRKGNSGANTVLIISIVVLVITCGAGAILRTALNGFGG